MTEKTNNSKTEANSEKKEIGISEIKNVYTAIYPSIKSARLIENYQYKLYKFLQKEISSKIAWIPPDMLCMQILFLGDIEEEYLEIISDKLFSFNKTEQILVKNPILKTIHEKNGSPRVLTLSFEPFPNDLQTLITNVKNKIIETGFHSKAIEVFPHITLARIPEEMPPFMSYIEKMDSPDFSILFNELIVGNFENDKNKILKGINLL